MAIQLQGILVGWLIPFDYNPGLFRPGSWDPASNTLRAVIVLQPWAIPSNSAASWDAVSSQEHKEHGWICAKPSPFPPPEPKHQNTSPTRVFIKEQQDI